MIIILVQGSSIFANAFRENIQELAKKTKDPTLAKEDGYPICIPTALPPFDYRNGMRVELETRDLSKQYVYEAIGLGSGSLNMVIAKSGSGKTAFAIQTACAIAQRFRSSFVIHFDLENGTNKMRIKNLSGWNTAAIADKYWLKSGSIGADMIKKILLDHAKMKIAMSLTNPLESTYFTGTYDLDGNPVYELVPTVCIIDSIPMIYEVDESGESNNMTGNIMLVLKLFNCWNDDKNQISIEAA